MTLSCAASVLFVIIGAVRSAVPPAARLAYARQGDYILGGLFPLHFTDCDAIPTMWSLQQAEAMAYTVDDINSRVDLLPNVTLGFDIRDSCRNEDLALWSSLSLVRGDNGESSCGNSSSGFPGKVVGIVGPMTSIASLTVTSVADLYDTPMITFGATSDELSDKDRFPYFLRTVPPDRLQAEAIVDLISHMGWEYVSIIYRADTYGIRGAHALESLAEGRGVCVALSLPVQKYPSHSELEKVKVKLLEARKARVLVIFAGLATANAVVGAARDLSMEEHFIWIGSEAWAHGVGRDGSGKTPPMGTVFVLLHNPEPSGFFEYFSSLDREAILKNPWFEIFLENWEAVNNCTVWVEDGCGIPHRDLYTPSSIMSPVIDAVYAFAYALHSLLNSSTSDTVKGKDFLHHLKAVSFQEERGRFEFNSDGAVSGKYLLQNAQMVQGEFQMVTVGLWDATTPERLRFDTDIIWADGSDVVPTSTCRDVCPTGSRVAPLKENCCFGCAACAPYAIVFNHTECIECEETEWPDEKRSSCVPITPVTTEWTHPLQLTILILSCMGLTLAVIIAFGLAWYRNHNVIKATSRELSSVNVLGLLLGFVAPFLLIAEPTPITCCMSQASVSLCFTLAYAPTLLKVCRIYRIFRAARKSAGRPRLISPTVQLTIVCFLILIQVICVIVTSAVHPCQPQLLTFRPREPRLELYCVFDTGFLVSSTYNLVLILACCVFAFLARRVPDNYNESKFIGASVYSTLLACLAAITVYYTSRDSLQKVAAICMAVLLNAYLTAACVYIPKLYAIRFLSSALQSTGDDERIRAGSRRRAFISQSMSVNSVHPGPST
ncbi:metabotropic glutamate receptor 4-like [Patiria miniata]|uniref:G-protein coupled receptors family 3 profile domain-containing protein n=1 Tax=Patiria miniata TaxID=46514 RepID=A0A914A407_PATMI|nr:metabotropic glutamate receptor 4-like [Patiria miniata]